MDLKQSGDLVAGFELNLSKNEIKRKDITLNKKQKQMDNMTSTRSSEGRKGDRVQEIPEKIHMSARVCERAFCYQNLYLSNAHFSRNFCHVRL